MIDQTKIFIKYIYKYFFIKLIKNYNIYLISIEFLPIPNLPLISKFVAGAILILNPVVKNIFSNI